MLDSHPPVCIRLPGAPGLILCADAIASTEGPRSATGVGRSAATATARMRSEIAEIRAPVPPAAVGRRPACAAAADADRALRAALHELVERRAAHLWWRGRPARRADAPARAAVARARRLWGYRRPGETGLVDISLDRLPPVLLAWSAAPDGTGLCFGVACRPTAPMAGLAALRELCQMEFGLALARRRARAGLDLPQRDRIRLDRAGGLTLATCDCRPEAGVPALRGPPMQTPPALLRALSATGIAAETAVIRLSEPSRHVAFAWWSVPADAEMPPGPAGDEAGDPTGGRQWPLYL